MKKLTLLLFALVAWSASNAQLFQVGNVGIGYIYVGPKIGGNASYMSITETTGSAKAANYGFQLGAVGQFGITKKLSIQPELVYTTKGYTEDFSTYKSNANYKYIGIPVVAKYAFMAFKKIDIYGAGGFYTDVLTGVEQVYSDNPASGEVAPDLSPFSRVDFGFNFGGGAYYSLNNGDRINIDLNVGFGAIKTQNFWGTSEGRNTSVQLSAIYLFDLTHFISFKGKSNANDGYEEDVAPAGGAKVERE